MDTIQELIEATVRAEAAAQRWRAANIASAEAYARLEQARMTWRAAVGARREAEAGERHAAAQWRELHERQNALTERLRRVATPYLNEKFAAARAGDDRNIRTA
jgi:hypothetical protein